MVPGGIVRTMAKLKQSDSFPSPGRKQSIIPNIPLLMAGIDVSHLVKFRIFSFNLLSGEEDTSDNMFFKHGFHPSGSAAGLSTRRFRLSSQAGSRGGAGS